MFRCHPAGRAPGSGRGTGVGAPTRHVTGGSLPVQSWSRYMRGALQGVPVAALPGYSSGGGLFASLFGSGNDSPPTPPQPVADRRQSATTGSGSLDGWLLNSLFGRR